MQEKQDRRHFMQTSLAAGAGLTVGNAMSNGEPSRPEAAPAADANPVVRAGRIRWHGDFDAACAAAQRSGKPVLLFQMMGRLDQKFC